MLSIEFSSRYKKCIVKNRCELYLFDTGTHEDVF